MESCLIVHRRVLQGTERDDPSHPPSGKWPLYNALVWCIHPLIPLFLQTFPCVSVPEWQGQMIVARKCAVLSAASRALPRRDLPRLLTSV